MYVKMPFVSDIIAWVWLIGVHVCILWIVYTVLFEKHGWTVWSNKSSSFLLTKSVVAFIGCSPIDVNRFQCVDGYSFKHVWAVWSNKSWLIYKIVCWVGSWCINTWTLPIVCCSLWGRGKKFVILTSGLYWELNMKENVVTDRIMKLVYKKNIICITLTGSAWVFG